MVEAWWFPEHPGFKNKCRLPRSGGGRLVVLDVNSSDDSAFRLVATYAPTGIVQFDKFMRLESFLGKSRTLILVGD